MEAGYFFRALYLDGEDYIWVLVCAFWMIGLHEDALHNIIIGLRQRVYCLINYLVPN